MAFDGIIGEIPLGIDGLTGNKNLSQLSIGSLLQADNISFENGTLQKEGGAAKYNSSAITGAPSIIGGHDWFPSSATQRMIVLTSGGKLLKDSGTAAFPVELFTGLTVTDIAPVFIDGGKEAATNNRKLFLFTKSNQVNVLSGDSATSAAMSTPAADWTGSTFPITGCIHEGRLWAFMGHRAYYSTTTDHENFTGATSGSLNVYPGEGEEIRAALSFKGLIIIWKYPRGIFLIDTSDPDTTKWRVIKHSEKIGSPGSQCAVPIDDDIVFLDTGGNIHLISAITEFGNLGGRSLSKIQRIDVKIRDEYEVSRLWNARGVFYTTKNELHFSCSALNSTTNDRRLVIDLNRQDVVRFRESTRDTLESLWIRQDADNIPSLVGGDNVGFVWELDQTTKSKDGSGYASVFQTPYLDLGHIDPALTFVEKSGAFLEIVSEPKGQYDLAIDVYWDEVLYETITFNLGAQGGTLGSFILGTDTLGGQKIEHLKKPLQGMGKRVSFAGRQSGADQDFSIGKMYIHFTKGP